MIAYFDCFSGISGDMTLGAMTDLGVPLEWLKEQLAQIPLKGFDMSITKERRQGISANRIHISLVKAPPPRTYGDIRKLIGNSRLSARVKETSLAIFDKVAEAEAHIHHEAKERVHFHEVGALDSIIDIVGTALCLEYLDIKTIIASKIPLGKGFVTCQHGTLPVPAPATLEILKDIPVFGSGIEQELVTPTGAAIIATLSDRFDDMPAMNIAKIGYGAGRHDNTSIPNLLRIIKGVPTIEADARTQEYPGKTIVMVETCIDDMNPEFYGYIMERLFEDGALDVYWVPIFMKKNRPGTMIQVLCEAANQPVVVHRILTETTSIGVRFHNVYRQTLSRKQIKIQTKYGEVCVKQITGPDEQVRFVPEYEECRKIAQNLQCPLHEVYAEICTAASDNSLTKNAPDCRDEP